MANEQKGSDGLTHRQRDFVSNYVLNGGNGTLAALEAGYSKNGCGVRSWELLRKPEIQKVIQEQCRRFIAECAPCAIKVLKELAESASSESVKLGAANSLLDRAGYKHVEKLEISDNRTIEDVDRELAMLLGITPPEKDKATH